MTRQRTLTLTLALSLLLLAAFAQAGESIQVELKSGRKFAGRVHKRSNAKLLWLEAGRPSAKVVRPIRWDRIEQASVGRSKLPAKQLRSRVEQLKQIQPAVAPARVVRTPHDDRSDAERSLELLGFKSEPE